jgi:hypothetical protein
MELRLKDRDQALRSLWIHQKELTNIIEEHKKLRRAERNKAAAQKMIIYTDRVH